MVYVKSLLAGAGAFAVATVLAWAIVYGILGLPKMGVAVDARVLFGRWFFWLGALFAFGVAFFWEFRRAAH